MPGTQIIKCTGPELSRPHNHLASDCSSFQVSLLEILRKSGVNSRNNVLSLPRWVCCENSRNHLSLSQLFMLLSTAQTYLIPVSSSLQAPNPTLPPRVDFPTSEADKGMQRPRSSSPLAWRLTFSQTSSKGSRETVQWAK